MAVDWSAPCEDCGGAAHVSEVHVQAFIASRLSGHVAVSPGFCLCDHGCAERVEIMALALESMIDVCPDINNAHAMLRETAEALRRSGRLLTPDLLPSGGMFRTAGV